MKVYTSEYLSNEYGVLLTPNIKLYITGDNDESPYCCHIDNNDKLHVFGGKYEVYNGNQPVSIDTVVDLLELNANDGITLTDIINVSYDISEIKSVCSHAHVLFNDEYITIEKYINEYISAFIDMSAFDVITFDVSAIDSCIIAVRDCNNTNNQYCITVRVCDTGICTCAVHK